MNKLQKIWPELRKVLFRIGILLGFGLFLIQAWKGFQVMNTRVVVIEHPTGLVLGLLFVILAMSLQITAWKTLMKHLNVRLSWMDVFENYTLSFLPRYIPGTVWGYFNRAEWLYQKHNTPLAISHLGSLLEVALIFQGILFSVGVYLLRQGNGFFKGTIIAGFILLPFLSWKILHWLLKESHVRNILALDKHNLDVLGIRFHSWLELVIYHCTSWFLYGFSLNSIIRSFNADTVAGVITLSTTFSISWLLGFLVLFVPSGLGIREQSLAELLVRLAQITPYQANSVSVFSRFLMISGEVFLLALGVLIKQFKRILYGN